MAGPRGGLILWVPTHITLITFFGRRIDCYRWSDRSDLGAQGRKRAVLGSGERVRAGARRMPGTRPPRPASPPPSEWSRGSRMNTFHRPSCPFKLSCCKARTTPWSWVRLHPAPRPLGGSVWKTSCRVWSAGVLTPACRRGAVAALPSRVPSPPPSGAPAYGTSVDRGSF